MAWFLYLIECNDGSIYTGIAVDVAARFAAHSSGKGARYTRSRPPRRLLAVVSYPDRSAASKAEYAMKRLSAAEKRRFCLRREGLWCLTVHQTVGADKKYAAHFDGSSKGVSGSARQPL